MLGFSTNKQHTWSTINQRFMSKWFSWFFIRMIQSKDVIWECHPVYSALSYPYVFDHVFDSNPWWDGLACGCLSCFLIGRRKVLLCCPPPAVLHGASHSCEGRNDKQTNAEICFQVINLLCIWWTSCSWVNLEQFQSTLESNACKF